MCVSVILTSRGPLKVADASEANEFLEATVVACDEMPVYIESAAETVLLGEIGLVDETDFAEVDSASPVHKCVGDDYKTQGVGMTEQHCKL